MKNYLLLLILIFIIILLNINKKKNIIGGSVPQNNYNIINIYQNVLTELNLNNFEISFTTKFTEIYLNKKNTNQIYTIKTINFDNYHLGVNPTEISSGWHKTYLTQDKNYLHKFYIVEGLIPGVNHISFLSVDKPNYYLRQHSNFLKLNNETYDNTYKNDATFIITGSLGGFKDYISFRNLNYLTHYIHHENYIYYVNNRDTKTYNGVTDTIRFNGESSLLLEPLTVENVLPLNTNKFNIYPINSKKHNINFKKQENSILKDFEITNNYEYKLANINYNFFIFNNIACNIKHSTNENSTWTIKYNQITNNYSIKNNSQSLIELTGNKFKIKNTITNNYLKVINNKIKNIRQNEDIFKLKNIIENHKNNDILCDISTVDNTYSISNNNPDNISKYNIKNYDLNVNLPKSISVVSTGYNQDIDIKDLTKFSINGNKIDFTFTKSIKGFNVLVLYDNLDLNTMKKYTYDTSTSEEESNKLASLINNVEINKIVILAIREDGFSKLNNNLKTALKNNGAKEIINLELNNSYIFIFKKLKDLSVVLAEQIGVENSNITLEKNSYPIYNNLDINTNRVLLKKINKPELKNTYCIKNITNNSYLHYPNGLLYNTLKVISHGMEDTNGKVFNDLVEFHINSIRLEFKLSKLRGFNIITINNNINKYSFDTHDSNDSYSESKKLSTFIDNIQDEKFIVIAVRDEAYNGLLDSTKELFKTKLNSNLIDNLGYRDSYILVVQKTGITFTNIYEEHKKKTTGHIEKTLDLVIDNNLSGAYALKQLYDIYTGPILRIITSKTNKEADIYFDKNGKIYSIDTNENNNYSLINFLNKEKALILKWYDQSTSKNDLTPENRNYLAELKLDTNGNYGIYFDNKNDLIELNNKKFQNYTEQKHTIFTNYNINSVEKNSNNIFYIKENDSKKENDSNKMIGYSVGKDPEFGSVNLKTTPQSLYYFGNTESNLYTDAINDKNIILYYENGKKNIYIKDVISETQSTITLNGENLTLGVGNYNTSNGFDGFIYNLVIYNDMLNENLRKNINTRLNTVSSTTNITNEKNLVWSAPNVRFENIKNIQTYYFTFEKYSLTNNDIESVNIEKKVDTYNTYYISYKKKSSSDIFYLSNSNFNGMLIETTEKTNNEFIIVPYNNNKKNTNIVEQYKTQLNLSTEDINTIMPSFNNSNTYKFIGKYYIYNSNYYIAVDDTKNIIAQTTEDNEKKNNTWYILENNGIYYFYNETTNTYLGQNNIINPNTNSINYFNIEYNITPTTLIDVDIKNTIINKYLLLNSAKIIYSSNNKLKWSFKKILEVDDSIIFKMKNDIITINCIKYDIYSNLLLTTYYNKLNLLHNNYELNIEYYKKNEYIDIINNNVIHKIKKYEKLYNINLDYVINNINNIYNKSGDLNKCLINLNYILNIENINTSKNYIKKYINKPIGNLISFGNDINNKYNVSISIIKKNWLNNGPLHYFNTPNNNIDVYIYSNKNFILIDNNIHKYYQNVTRLIHIVPLNNNKLNKHIYNIDNISLILNLSYTNNTTYNIRNNYPIYNVNIINSLTVENTNFRLEKIPNKKYLFYIYIIENAEKYYINDDELTTYPRTPYNIVPVDLFKAYYETTELNSSSYYLNINNNINNIDILLKSSLIKNNNLVNNLKFKFIYNKPYFNIYLESGEIKGYLGSDGKLHRSNNTINTNYDFKLINYNNPFCIVGTNDINYNNIDNFIKNEHLIYLGDSTNTYYLYVYDSNTKSMKFISNSEAITNGDNKNRDIDHYIDKHVVLNNEKYNISPNYPDEFLWKLSYVDSIKNKLSSSQSGGNNIPDITYYINDRVFFKSNKSISDLTQKQSDECVILYKQDVKLDTFDHIKINGTGTFTAATDLECSNLCRDNQECNAWVREPSNNNCWLNKKQEPILFQPRDDRNSGLKCRNTYHNNILKINVPQNVLVTIYDQSNYSGISYTLTPNKVNDLTKIRCGNTNTKWNSNISSIKIEKLRHNEELRQGILDSVDSSKKSIIKKSKYIKIISTGNDAKKNKKTDGTYDNTNLVKLFINSKRIVLDTLKKDRKLYVNNIIPVSSTYGLRGFHVIILDNNLDIETYRIYDTHESSQNYSKLFADFISTVDNTKIIIIAVYDEASANFNKFTRDTLLSLGANIEYITNIGWQHSYILIATQYKKLYEKYNYNKEPITVTAKLETPLDTFKNNVTCAYALRNLFSDYNKPIIRIQLPNEDEKDLYFDQNGKLLNSIENINNTKIIKWYDQSNNKNDLVSTNTDYPILFKENEKYKVKFIDNCELKLDKLNNFNGRIDTLRNMENRNGRKTYIKYPHTIFTKYNEDEKDKIDQNTNLFYIGNQERKLRIISCGNITTNKKNYSSLVEFYINNKKLKRVVSRGFNVIVLDNNLNNIKDLERTFDTHVSQDNANKLQDFIINTVPNNRIIVMAVYDEAAQNLKQSVRDTFKNKLNATLISDIQWQQSYVLVVRKQNDKFIKIHEEKKNKNDLCIDVTLVLKEWDNGNIAFHTRWDKVGANYYFLHNDILPIKSNLLDYKKWNTNTENDEYQKRNHIPLLDGALTLSYNGYITHRDKNNLANEDNYYSTKYNKNIIWNNQHQNIWCYNNAACTTDLLYLEKPFNLGIGNYLPRLNYDENLSITTISRWQFRGTMDYFILVDKKVEDNTIYKINTLLDTVITSEVKTVRIEKELDSITNANIDMTTFKNTSDYIHRFKLTNTEDPNIIINNIILEKNNNKYLLKKNNKYINIGTDRSIIYNSTAQEFNINIYKKLFNNTFLYKYKSNKSIQNIVFKNINEINKTIRRSVENINFNNNDITTIELNKNEKYNIIDVKDFSETNEVVNDLIIEKNNMSICGQIKADSNILILDNTIIDIEKTTGATTTTNIMVTDVNKYFNNNLTIEDYDIKLVEENKLIHLSNLDNNISEDLVLSLVNENLILYHRLINEKNCIYFNVLINKKFDFTTTNIKLKFIPYNNFISLCILCNNYLFDYVENINIYSLQTYNITANNIQMYVNATTDKILTGKPMNGYRYKIKQNNYINSIIMPIKESSVYVKNKSYNINSNVVSPRLNIETYIKNDTTVMTNNLENITKKINYTYDTNDNDLYDLIKINNSYRLYNEKLNSYLGENMKDYYKNDNSESYHIYYNNTNIDFNIEETTSTNKFMIRNIKSNKTLHKHTTKPNDTYLTDLITYLDNSLENNTYTFEEIGKTPYGVTKKMYNEKYLPKHNYRYRIKHINSNKYVTLNNNSLTLQTCKFEHQDFNIIYHNNCYIFVLHNSNNIIGLHNIIYNTKNINHSFISFKLENSFINNCFTINNNNKYLSNNTNSNKIVLKDKTTDSLDLLFSFELIYNTPLNIESNIKKIISNISLYTTYTYITLYNTGTKQTQTTTTGKTLTNKYISYKFADILDLIIGIKNIKITGVIMTITLLNRKFEEKIITINNITLEEQKLENKWWADEGFGKSDRNYYIKNNKIYDIFLHNIHPLTNTDISLEQVYSKTTDLIQTIYIGEKSN